MDNEVQDVRERTVPKPHRHLSSSRRPRCNLGRVSPLRFAVEAKNSAGSRPDGAHPLSRAPPRAVCPRPLTGPGRGLRRPVPRVGPDSARRHPFPVWLGPWLLHGPVPRSLLDLRPLPACGGGSSSRGREGKTRTRTRDPVEVPSSSPDHNWNYCRHQKMTRKQNTVHDGLRDVREHIRNVGGGLHP